MVLIRPTKRLALSLSAMLLTYLAIPVVFAQPSASSSGVAVPTKEAGRVLMSIGDVKILRQSAVIPAVRGTIVETGDAIATGVASNVQFRMIDGAVIALRAQTEFKIDEYAYNGKEDGSEKAVDVGFGVEFVKGELVVFVWHEKRASERTVFISKGDHHEAAAWPNMQRVFVHGVAAVWQSRK